MPSPDDDTQVEPGLYVPHTEPVIQSVVFVQPDPYAPPTAFTVTAHCDTGLGYESGSTIAYGNSYNFDLTRLWMNNKVVSMIANGGTYSPVKSAVIGGSLYSAAPLAYASDATADYYRAYIKLAHHNATGGHHVEVLGPYYYKVMKYVAPAEVCPCGAAVERVDGVVISVGGDTQHRDDLRAP